MKVKIFAGNYGFLGELDENDPIGKQIAHMLPLEGTTQTWGGEIYFDISEMIEAHSEQMEVEFGDIAFWPRGPSVCIFFGKTPSSFTEKPRAHSPVVVIGKLLDLENNVEKLWKIKEDEKIRIEKL